MMKVACRYAKLNEDESRRTRCSLMLKQNSLLLKVEAELSAVEDTHDGVQEDTHDDVQE